MNTTNESNGWRLMGAGILLLILLVLWIMGLGPSFSGDKVGCCGVPVAENQAAPPVTPVAQSPVNVGFKAEDGKVILTGEMPTEAERHIALNTATAVFGAGNEIDKLTVWKDSSLPGWWQNIGKVLGWVKSGTDFGISQQGDKITLTGSAASEADKLAKEAGIKALLGAGGSLDNLMSVSQAAGASPMLEPVVNEPPPAKTEPPVTAAPEIPPCSRDMNVAIAFNLNSTGLSTEGKKQLDQLAACITSPTVVAGHTDNTGEASYNMMLSKARAMVVVKYLNSIKPDSAKQLSTAGYGESKPIADNATRAGRAKNRRIEFVAK
jgi:OOP family OmpA-OmpF porin